MDIRFGVLDFLYTGYPAIIKLDQESGFTSRAFKDLATAHGVMLNVLEHSLTTPSGRWDIARTNATRFFGFSASEM